MNILKCYMTNSIWYNDAGTSKKVGIVVHSTGANNPYIKRYVQPSENDENYDEIIEILGRNEYQNDWNHTSRSAGVHAFIGKSASNEILVVEVGPHELDAWGVGKGSKGSYNYSPNAHIQFEICEDALTNKVYFDSVMKKAQEYCAHLCKLYGWDETVICSHKESYDRGYGGNHADCDHWLAKFGKDMNWFRGEVGALLKNLDPANFEFELLDEVRVKDDVTTYYNGKNIPAWVYAATLYVRKINDDGTVVVSTQKTGAVTGTLWATDLDVVKIKSPVEVPKVEESPKIEDAPRVDVTPEAEESKISVVPEVEEEPKVEKVPEVKEPEVEETEVEAVPTKNSFVELLGKIITYILKFFKISR